MACVCMACIVMAYAVMACTVMAYICPACAGVTDVFITYMSMARMGVAFNAMA